MIAGLKPYPAYRDSGVEWLGEVPEGWEARRLRAIARKPIRNGLGESAGAFRPDWPRYIRITDIAGPRMLNEVGAASLPPTIAAEAEVADGDVLFAAVGATVGKSYLHRGGRPRACFAGYLVRLAPNDEVIPEFISYWTESTDYWYQVNRNAIKATIENLSASRYKRMRIPLPPLNDQSAAVRFLKHFDARIQRFIAAKERLVELLAEEKQATIKRAVTRGLDPHVTVERSKVDWPREIPEHWSVVPLRLRYSVRLGKMLDAKRITGASLLPYLRNTDVQWDRINAEDLPEMDISPDEQDRYTVKPGDLLVCEGGEVGRAAIWDQPGVVGYQKALHRLRPYDGGRDKPRFLYYVLWTMADLGLFKADGGESTIAHLTAEKLRRLRVPFPPAHEQEAIAKQLDRELEQREGVISTARSQIALLHEYRTRLISDVVTGKLDVREVAQNLPDDSEVDDLALDGRKEVAVA